MHLSIGSALITWMATGFADVGPVFAVDSNDCEKYVDKHNLEVLDASKIDLRSAVNRVKELREGAIFIPPGEYLVEGIRNGTTVLSFEGIDRLVIFGRSGSSTIALGNVNGFKSTRILSVFDTNNLYICNLIFDGKKSNYDGLAEQQSSVFVRRTKNIVIRNNVFKNAHGDGVNVGDVENVRIVNNTFSNNARNGVTIGHGDSREVVISRNYFDSRNDTQLIDTEHGTLSNLTITHNYMENLQPEDVVSMDQYGIVLTKVKNAQVFNNTVNNPVLIRNSSQIDFYDNSRVGHLTIDRESTDIKIANNYFTLLANIRKSNRAQAGIRIRKVDNLQPANITLHDNVFQIPNRLPQLIDLYNVKNVTLIRNRTSDGSPIRCSEVWRRKYCVRALGHPSSK